jgi:NADPH-dependent F420 reductase
MDKHTVAIIGGTGDLGSGLALRWAKAGLQVVIGSRSPDKAVKSAQDLLHRLGQDACIRGSSNEEAAASAPVVVITVPYEGQTPILRQIAPHLKPGTIVVDATVPFPTKDQERPVESAAEITRKLLPESVKVAAAFHTVSSHCLEDLSAPLDCDVLMCGDDEAKSILKELIELIPGARPVDVGRLSNARYIEPIVFLLIAINRKYKTNRAGIRITGLPERYA